MATFHKVAHANLPTLLEYDVNSSGAIPGPHPTVSRAVTVIAKITGG